MIKLCYQQYETSVTLGAHREFLKRQGNSLGYYIGKAIIAAASGQGGHPVPHMLSIAEAVPFGVALDIFDVITDKGVSKEELEDAMFRVDWSPTKRDGDMSEPWTFVLAKLAGEYGEIYNEIAEKKK
jgi:hypothetical protein